MRRLILMSKSFNRPFSLSMALPFDSAIAIHHFGV
jgi:hypothetical protein